MTALAWAPARLRHPWFAGIADLVERIAGAVDWPSIELLNERFAPELGTVGVQLVESGKTKPALRDGAIDPASLYEVRIADHGEVPTRARNAHDLLNTLIWAAFPHSKLALTRALAIIQRERAAGRTRMPPTRAPAHDRLALVDEGAVLRTPASTWIFGHAILEHAYVGELGVRGTVVELDAGPTRSDVDRAFAAAELDRVVRRGPGVPVSELL